MAEAKTSKWFWVLVSIVLACIGLVVIAYMTTFFETVKGGLVTFGISFLVGMGGAGVYLALLLMTEKNLTVLENGLVKDLNLMSLLFVMSGGFVAAITQTTSGLFTTNNLQAVFMVGFGWQGALTGVASSSTRVKLSDELQQTRLNATEGIEIALKAKDIKITQLTDALRKISEEQMKGAVS